MPMFKKRPVTVEARQFETNNARGDAHMDALVAWINGDGNKNAYHDGTDIFINTLEGIMTATVGDWIIKGVAGEFYPCKPSIFAQTYEAA